MNVCLISGSYPPMSDGVGDYTRTLFFRLKEQLGSNIILITTNTEQAQQDESQNVVGAVEMWSFRSIIKLMRRLRKMGPDVVHVQYPAAGYGRHPAINILPLLLRVAIPRVRVAATFHEFPSLTLKGRVRLMIGALFAHRVIIVERQYEQAMRRIWPRIEGKLIHIPVGSNIERDDTLPSHAQQATRSELGCTATDPIVAYFGTVKPKKGIELLLDAFDVMKTRIPEAHLLLLGHVDPRFHDDYLRCHPARMRHSDDIHVMGSLDATDVSRYLQIADVCALPFPDGVSGKRGSFMAALHHHLPIVTTEPQVPVDGLADGENVLLVPPGNANELARQVISLLEDTTLRERLSSNVADLAQMYSWERIADETLRQYESLLSR